ncbi:MAG: FG-GAP repeat protein, partial [Anaerolineae bacterium]|nr:FG-GAP repeat protein [Anaerolineae bacterium]
MLLASVGSVSAASYALDQKLTSADFTTDSPANVPDLEFGQAVAVSGNWMAVGAPNDNDGVGTVYVYERVSGTWAYRTVLSAPTPQAGAQFGAAVDIYEAGGLVTIIVGAPLQDASATNQGRAFIYSDTNASATLSFTTASVTGNAETDAHFGASVALFADIAAVGAPNDGASDGGLVSIQGRNVGGTNAWGQVATSKTGDAGSSFGTSVDVHGEYLIVGAPQALNASSLQTGQAYVYRQDLGGANNWGIKHTLSPSSGQPGQVFGQSVGVWDSVLGTADSASRSMVGSPLFDDTVLVDAGRVTFFGDGTAVSQFAGAEANEQLGYSVALENADALAGRPTRTITSQPNTGSVNTFSFSGGAWVTNTLNIAQTGAFANYFYGYSVDISGAVAVIGAPASREDALNLPPGAPRAGVVETLEKPGVTWAKDTDSTVIARFDLPNTATGQTFALSVDMTSDWLVVGVQGDAQRGMDAGAVYVYRNISGVWTPHSRLTGLYSQAGDFFGRSVAIFGTRIIVGAPGTDGFPTATSNAGSFYVYELSGSVWRQMAQIQSPNPTTNGFFGTSLDYQGDVLVVGATGENGNRGRAYAYRNFSSFASPITIDIAAASVSSDTGFSVSVFDPAPGTANDEVIAIGAYNENSSQGAAYVASGATFSTITTLVDPNPGSNRYFGYSVSIDNGRVAVGAPTASAAPSGRVVVFSGSGYSTATTLPTASGSAGQFGFAVNLQGNSLVIGSVATAARAGLAHVYGFSAGNWTEQGPLQPSDLATLDEYGSAVAQNNGLYVVGAPLHDANSIANSGAAYVFSLAP